MDYTTIDIDIEKRYARLLMPYIEINGAVDKESIDFFMGIGDMEDMVVSRDGENIAISMWFDYGAIIPDKIWEMFGKDSFLGICDIGGASEQLTKEAIIESVKHLYPKVVKMMEEASSDLIKAWTTEE